jgi:hypothetical protein
MSTDIADVLRTIWFVLPLILRFGVSTIVSASHQIHLCCCISPRSNVGREASRISLVCLKPEALCFQSLRYKCLPGQFSLVFAETNGCPFWRHSCHLFLLPRLVDTAISFKSLVGLCFRTCLLSSQMQFKISVTMRRFLFCMWEIFRRQSSADMPTNV